ncbi:MAG: MFS transporter [Candidatus Sulfopaludibacter sp.]|nr:MFS transporter [Candidatus Sulfopaludibacter sp.]
MQPATAFAVNEHSIRYEGWRVAVASSICVLVSFASLLVYTFAIFLKPLAAEFGWSREAVSAAFGIAALAVAACSPPLGWLLDRYPARRIILPCLTIFGCAFASLSLMTRHLWQLYATFLILGIVGNGTAHLAYSRALTTWFQERRGVAFSILLGGGALGAMILPPVAEALIRTVGWRASFAILGAAVLVIGLPCGARIRARSRFTHSASLAAAGASVSEGLRSRIFWIIVVELFLISVSQNGAITHLSALLTDRGISAGKAALAVSSMGGAILAGRLITGWLLDRYFAPRVAACLFAISAVGTYLLAGAQSLPVGIEAAALIGFGMGGEGDVTPYLLSRYFGLRSFSTLYGFTWTAYAIAGAVGPVIMGRAFDATGSYSGLLVRLAEVTLVAASLMLLLPRYKA